MRKNSRLPNRLAEQGTIKILQLLLYKHTAMKDYLIVFVLNLRNPSAHHFKSRIICVRNLVTFLPLQSLLAMFHSFSRRNSSDCWRERIRPCWMTPHVRRTSSEAAFFSRCPLLTFRCFSALLAWFSTPEKNRNSSNYLLNLSERAKIISPYTQPLAPSNSPLLSMATLELPWFSPGCYYISQEFEGRDNKRGKI